MKISVIITCYNREKTIGRAIESVLNQDYPDFELVIIDDGSGDGSPHLIKNYEAAFLSRVKAIYQENAGVAAARNAGLAAATGEYVTYLDSDDYMCPGALTELAKLAKSGDYDQILYDAWMENPDGTRTVYRPFHDAPAEGIEEGELTASQLVLSNPCPWNRLMKKQLWSLTFGSKEPFPVGLLYEDLGTIPILAVCTNRSYYLEKPLVVYAQSEGSIMRQKGYNPHYDDIFKVADRLRKSLGFKFPMETEYLIFDHVLISGGKRYLSCRKKQKMKDCAEYTGRHYPNWAENPIVKKEPAKKQTLGRLIYGRKYLTLKLLGK